MDLPDIGMLIREAQQLRQTWNHKSPSYLRHYLNDGDWGQADKWSALATSIFDMFTALYLMPSSFEPCGISQMLAMRAAQPCVVHGVGGLRDTVDDNRSGFVFDGETTTEQAGRFVAETLRALELKSNNHDEWQKICIRAANARFSWSKSARATIEQLYEHH